MKAWRRSARTAGRPSLSSKWRTVSTEPSRHQVGTAHSTVTADVLVPSAVSGLSFGIISGVFSVINILADSIGPGIVGIHGDSPYYFITSGEAGGWLGPAPPQQGGVGGSEGFCITLFPQHSSPWPWFCCTPSGE